MYRSIPWLAAVLCFVTPGIALAQQPPGPGYGPHMMWNGGWHGWFFGPIMMIVFIAIVAVVILFLVRWLGAPGHGAALHHPPGKTRWTSSRNALPGVRSTRTSLRSGGACWMNRISGYRYLSGRIWLLPAVSTARR